MCLVRKWQLAKYRGVSVNHLTSPPLSRLLAPGVLASILPSAASGCPDYTAVLVHAYNLPVRALSLPRACRPLAPFSLVVTCEASLAREIWTQFSVTRIAKGLGPTIAWKASPTRTPPPICTFAPCLVPRWFRDRGRREQLINTTWRADGNAVDSNSSAATTARGAPQQGGRLLRKSNALIHFADSTRTATVTFSSK
jgi:hypothetical protein